MSTISELIQNALSMIHNIDLTDLQKEEIMNNTVQGWKTHINPSFLQYRKSVSNDFALLDWYDAFPGTPWFKDHRGNKYIDLLGGYGIYNVGRRHPHVVQTVQCQLQKQALHSQELLDPLRVYCAQIMTQIMPSPSLKNFFFTNSGTESVEACLKMALVSTGRKTIISCVNGFHGKTLGSLACTSKAVFRKPFLNHLLHIIHVPFNDLQTLEIIFQTSVQIGDPIAGIIIEPIQGEGGIHVATPEFLKKARELCDQYESILIFDEVQSGMGRTGKWWACEHDQVVPDLMAIGKAFGGGVIPAGACVGNDKVWSKYVNDPFLFTTTFGGNPLAMASAIATVDVILREELLKNTSIRGDQFRKGLIECQSFYPHIVKEIRGRGLMLGIEFQTNEQGIEFSKKMLENGVLVAGTLSYAKTIRVEPSLTIKEEDVVFVVSRIKKVLSEIHTRYFSSKL
jgi:putrescine aminotransferase